LSDRCFSSSQKNVYYALIGETKPVAGASCGPISPDKAGTISGSWFASPYDPHGDPNMHFSLMIGTYSDGIIRISGEDFQPSIKIPPTNSTFLDPQLVTTRHCYSADGKMVDFKIVSDKQALVFSGSGSCGAAFPTTGFKNYFR